MHEPMSLLDPTERSLLIKLIDTTSTLAEKIEQRLPRSIRSEHWQLDKHSPAPWQALYWKHRTDLAPSDLEALSLRANLADVAAILHASSHQIDQAEKTTPPDLSLRKVKRVTL